MARRNVKKTLQSVFELTKEEMDAITPEEWEAACRLAEAQEALYIAIDSDEAPIEEPMEEENEPEIEEEAMEVVLKCDNCDFQTDLPRIFKRHSSSLRTCSFCTKVFCGNRAKDRLKSHEKKEHSVKPVHKCQNCGKEFKFRCKLKEHLVWAKCGRSNDQLNDF